MQNIYRTSIMVVIIIPVMLLLIVRMSYAEEKAMRTPKISNREKMKPEGKQKSYAFEYYKIDDQTVLITDGFKYRKGYILGDKIHIAIRDVVRNGILYPEGGMPFIPLCAESEASIEKRNRERNQDPFGFSFEPLSDAVGVTWIFSEPGIKFSCYNKPYVISFKSRIRGATIEFTEKGVLVKGFLIDSDGARKMVSREEIARREKEERLKKEKEERLKKEEEERLKKERSDLRIKLQEEDIVGTWLSPKLNYLWHFHSDRTFENEKGTKGVWSVDEDYLITKATNQGSNPSNYRFRLTHSGRTLEGSWSSPSGGHGEFVLQRQ